MKHETIFSPCRTYRYILWREWEWDSMFNQGYAMFIGLNPSTADETKDDPTIRRCISFAKSWGYGALCMTNLFAFRSTDPKKMLQADDPIGPDNDKWIIECARGAGVVVAAWGKHGRHGFRGATVSRLVPDLTYLRLNLDGSPEHPLYLPKILKPLSFAEVA